ncbi:MAG: tellurite resistance TerB C-terminal domain-containing protein [Bacteroidota bacterium]
MKKITKYLFVTLLLIVAANLKAQTFYQISSDTKLRTGASIKFKSLGIVKSGERVNMIEQTNASWYKIEYNGKVGFILSRYVTQYVEEQKIVDTSKIDEKSIVEVETKKSNSTIFYVVGGIVLLILIFVVTSNDKNKKGDNGIPSQKNDNIIIDKEEKDELIKNISNNIKIEVITSNSNNFPKDNSVIDATGKTYNNSEIPNQENDKAIIDKEERDKLLNNIVSSLKTEVTISNPNDLSKDDSIIDITGKVYNLDIKQSNLVKYKSGVPFWVHQYIYSHSEILNASYEQVNFYTIFKKAFLNGEYLDLEGNNNYAFVLLFEFLLDYDHYKDVNKLKNQLTPLGIYYPKTKYYCDSFFAKKMAIKEPDEKIVVNFQIQESSQHRNTYPEYQYNPNAYADYEYWKLGSKYKSKLNLNEEEVKLLNRLWYPSNNFCNVEFCCIEILKLYLLTIETLKNKYTQEQTTLEQEFTKVVDVILRKHFRYHLDSYNYKSSIESISNEIYINIFKRCENVVREHYGHKRKINTDSYFTATEAKLEFESKVIEKVEEVFPTLVSKITLPDEPTEIELNSQNTNRWKIKFDDLIVNYKNNSNLFVENILALGNLNKQNPSIENIFFEASKFISKYEKETALTLYVHYLYYDLKSATFDNKQLTKTIQKNLFKTNEQLRDFEILVSELIKDKNLEKALKGVAAIYVVKRKKIQLDTASIKEVEEQHSGTVELLNEYLKDEYEDESSSIKTEEINSEEVKIEITQKTNEVEHSIYLSSIAFTQAHTATLEMFTKSNFSVSQSELEIFAKSKGLFKNQLIESINEICYESLDDVLIEEEEDYYIINPNYYQTLLVK